MHRQTVQCGVNGWLKVMKGSSLNVVKQLWYRQGTVNSNDFNTYVRTRSSGVWSDWKRFSMDG